MKSNLLIIAIFFSYSLSAQPFIDVSQSIPFDKIADGSIAFADIDGDNDLDVLITGNGTQVTSAKLYTNDGGVFTEVVGTPFDRVRYSSVAFADVDGDNDKDLLITGQNSAGLRIAKLYSNDSGVFTEVIGTPFDGVGFGSIAFADVDRDNDLDLLITGHHNPFDQIAKLYTNDMGTFTEVIGTPFDGVNNSSVAFADIDGDNDKDVLITGTSNSGARIAKLYTNDMGTFTEVVGTPFEAVQYGSVAFADIDGDNDPDVLISGYSVTGAISKLYTNDGGEFTEVVGTPFQGVGYSSIAFADVDGDNDQDLFITGLNGSNSETSELYANNEGTFTKVAGTPFQGVAYGSVAFADVDGDNDLDILIAGRISSSNRATKLYSNERMASSVKSASNDLNFNFEIFPNPTGLEILNIHYTATEYGQINVKIFDLNGHLIQQQRSIVGIGQHNFSVDISSLEAGGYIIQLETETRKGTRVFLVP